MPILARWPIEYAEQLVVGRPASNWAICCSWSSRDRLKSLLDANQYAVIGNLYSRAGINPMLRNILANPVIRHVVLTGKSLTDSDDALLGFFEGGVDHDWRIVGNGGQIDRDIPLDVLEEVRRGVRLVDLRGVRNFAAAFRDLVHQVGPLPPFASPRSFPKTPPSVPTVPTEFTGFVIRRPTILEAWCEALWTVMTFGHTSPTDYGLEQKEVLALLSVVEHPVAPLDRLPDWAPFKREEIRSYVEQFFRAQKGDDISYSYGHRLQSHWGKDQIALLAAELRRSGHSRRALANLWDPVEDSISKDPPCITAVQATVRRGRLHLMAYIRSNDMFRAYPLNATALAELQARLAKQLDVGMGPLTILSFSAHIYSDCWDACHRAAAEATTLRKRFEPDPRGSFVFRLQNGQFAADHYSPAGDLVQSFTARTARELSALIAPFVGRVDHGLYLGREVFRLASSLESGTHYEQDKVT